MTDTTNQPARERKIVRVAGLEFTVHSSRERSCTLEGRYFFAIGRNCAGWTLFEHDAALFEQPARPLGRKFERVADSEDLVTEIRRLVETGDQLPNDLRPAWEIDEERFRESVRVAECRRITKADAKREARKQAEDAKHARWVKRSGIEQCQYCLGVGPAGGQCQHCGAYI